MSDSQKQQSKWTLLRILLKFVVRCQKFIGRLLGSRPVPGLGGGERDQIKHETRKSEKDKSEKKSKWSIVKHSLIFIQRMKKKPAARAEDKTPETPKVIQEIYARTRRRSTSALGIDRKMQEEIYQICGEEINLYLRGVNIRAGSDSSME
ncbi:uncharacterized protein LOC111705522 [Eurytemora carolleeae]|uniref:uncharacterized protein LOC111705522 n=1 Tax=Eurytemora carolleeae TaxID=1294199 RepID=UPI000C792428|nr:uncharacterized protein LOC111705522 [Eurytemora carolleeae]|eukprot:XP_023333869.1 uncharacterized protein LOC111705522 [Eurytemora affinis]